MLVNHTSDRFSQTSIFDYRKRSGRPRVVQTNAVIKTVSARNRRISFRKQKIMWRKINISTKSFSRLIRYNLHRKAYRRLNIGSATRLKQIRLNRCQQLLQWQAVYSHESILFVDEKIFDLFTSVKKFFKNWGKSVFFSKILFQNKNHPEVV